MHKHTPGPLNVHCLGETENTNQGWLVRKEFQTVAVVRSSEADANLYAAAPELLEACIRWRDMSYEAINDNKELKFKASDYVLLQRAINKAEGRAA